MNLINRSLFKIRFIIFFLLFSFFAHAQEGIPLIKKYSVEDYRAGIENWDAVEDNRNILYFANSEGVLEFDGVHWRLIRTKSGNAVRSLTKDVDGTIYVGGDYDFGYLKTNVQGQNEYESLLGKCPVEVRSNLKRIWKVFIFQGKKFFLAEGWIVVLDAENNYIKAIKEDIYLRSIFLINNKVYAYSNSRGILSFDDQKLKFAVLYASPHILNRSIECIAIHPKGGIRYHLFDEGFYHLNDGNVRLEKKTTTSKIDTDYIFCQTELKNDFVTGTTIGGLYLINKNNLTPKYHFNKELGLNDNKIFAVYEDQYKNLWVCHENGLSYIVFNTPFRFFNERLDIKGAGLCSEIFNGQVFIGTTHGLFSCDQKSQQGFYNFKLVELLRQPIFFLMKKESKLLIGTLHGLYQYDGNTFVKISQSGFNKNIKPYPFGKEYYLTSSNNGFQLLQFENGFKVVHSIFNQNQEIIDFEVDVLGNVWWIDSESNLLRGELNETLDTFNVTQSFKANNQQALKYLSLTRFNDTIIIGTDKGLFRYEAKSNAIRKIYLEKYTSINESSIHLLFNQNNSNLWLQESNFTKGKLDYNIDVLDHEFNIKNSVKNLNSSVYGNKVFSFDNYNESTLAIGVSEGFLLYDLDFKKDKISKSRTYIRNVFFKDENNSFSIEGVWKGTANFCTQTFQGEETKVDFNCSANYYYSPNKIFYSYMLVGVDDVWSDWTVDNKKTYAIHGDGKYIFKVRTTNDYNNISEETSYRFTISKPWYQTYWWYAIEISTLILLMSLSVYYNRMGSSKISRISAIITVLTILTVFETMSELVQDWMDAQGETIFALKIAINITIALSIIPIETWLKKKLIFRPIDKKE